MPTEWRPGHQRARPWVTCSSPPCSTRSLSSQLGSEDLSPLFQKFWLRISRCLSPQPPAPQSKTTLKVIEVAQVSFWLGPSSCPEGCSLPPCPMLWPSHPGFRITLTQMCELVFFQDESHLAISCSHFQLLEVPGGHFSVLMNFADHLLWSSELFAPVLGLWGLDTAWVSGHPSRFPPSVGCILAALRRASAQTADAAGLSSRGLPAPRHQPLVLALGLLELSPHHWV